MMGWLYTWVLRRFQRELQNSIDAPFNPEISRALDGIDAALEYLQGKP